MRTRRRPTRSTGSSDSRSEATSTSEQSEPPVIKQPSARFLLQAKQAASSELSVLAKAGLAGVGSVGSGLAAGAGAVGSGLATGAGAVGSGLATGAQSVGTGLASSGKSVGTGIATGASKVGDAAVGAKHVVEDKVDSVVEDRVDWVLSLVGIRVSKMIVDPFMPEKLQAAIRAVWDSFWPDIAANVRDDVMAVNGFRQKRHRKHLISLDKWPSAPPLWPPTFRAIRARVLYAVLPADIGFWQLVRKPAVYPVLLFLFFPFASVSTLTWVLLLLIIDHNDEYQLANYILVFRAALFVTVGLYWSIKGFVQLYLCVTAVDADCLLSGPGVTDYQTWRIAMTLARLVCGWISFVLLTRLRLREQSRQLSLGQALANAGEQKEKQFKRTSAAKIRVTRYEAWAATGCAVGIVGGFAVGLMGTTLLFFEFSFDGREHDTSLEEFENTLLPISLLPSVNAIVGAAVGFSAALVKEFRLRRRMRQESLKVIAAAERCTMRIQDESSEPRRMPIPRTDAGIGIPGMRGRSLTPANQPKNLTRYEKTLWRAFCVTDVDRSGSLTAVELLHALRLCGIQATDLEVEELLGQYDWDKSGGLEWPEFRDLGNRLRHHVRVPALDPMTKLLLYEAGAFTSTVFVVILNGYLYIGPQVFWDTSPNFFWYTFNILLYGPEEPIVRMTLYFGLSIGCLISFLPFVVFKFPLLGPALLKIKPTGYDQEGNCRVLLTRAQKAAKADVERREREKKRRGTEKTRGGGTGPLSMLGAKAGSCSGRLWPSATSPSASEKCASSAVRSAQL